MTVFRRLSLILLFIATVILISASITSCDNSLENGIQYSGSTVVGADKNAESLTVKDGTTSIASGAFADCKNLSSVTLPDSITEIAAGAFSGCDALIKREGGVAYVENWVIGADIDATDITIKAGTRGIAREAFIGITTLKSVSIPDSVENIGARAFFRCSSLEKITLPFIGKGASSKNSMHFGYIFGAFNKEQNSEYVPESLIEVNITSAKWIADYAFSGCSKIKTVSLPSTLTEIGAHAFSDCTALSEIIIPDSVGCIKEKAFYKCSALTTVKLPENESFTEILEYTFAYCSSIKEITIPHSVDKIGACAIARCTSLESLTIENNTLERIGQQAFDGCTYLTSVDLSVKSLGKGAFQNCISLTDVTLGMGTVEIESYAFNGCSGITDFSMPESVRSIGEHAFYACHSLTYISIGEGITSIEKSTFQNCINLSGVTIPCSVSHIGENAFAGCTKLVTKEDGVSYVDDWITDIQPSVTSIEITDAISGFADGAFSGAVNLSEITFTGSADIWESVSKTIPKSTLSSINVIINANKS